MEGSHMESKGQSNNTYVEIYYQFSHNERIDIFIPIIVSDARPFFSDIIKLAYLFWFKEN